MTPDESLSLADNPNFIEGIYNYCYRWCERCTMTSRCLVYATTPSDEDIQEGSAEDKKQAMFRQIENSFQLTIDLLNKLATEHGIDLNKGEDSENTLQEHRHLRGKIEKSSLSRLAKEYLDCTHQWLNQSDDFAQAKDRELQQAFIMELPDRNPEQELADLKNALDVVHWYYFQINVKLVRAQASRIRQTEWEDEEAPAQKDSDGSAKVALIGIERSIGAWGMLLHHFPDQENSILHLLSILERLLHMTETEFPDARGFFRNGLD